jgi:phage terminase large subunit
MGQQTTKTEATTPPANLGDIRALIEAAYRAGCPQDQVERFLRAGIVLQPRQLLASAAAREMDSGAGPVELGYGGARGGGKSHWLVGQMGADDCQRHEGLKCLLLRKVGKALSEAFDDLRPKILGRVPHEYFRQRGVLEFANGSRILLGNFKDEKDIDKYLGLEYDVIGVEEATTLTASKYSDIRTCCRSSKPGWRPRMYSTTNPGGVGHTWYKNRFITPHRDGGRILPLAAQTGPTRFIPATADDNRFLNREYVASVLDGLTGWKLRAWRYGDWDIAAGQFFTNWSGPAHVKRLWSQVPDNVRVWCAMDYGWTHYTVIYLVAESDGVIYLVDEHAERRWLVERHAEAIYQMLERNGVQPWQLWTFVAGSDVFAKRGEEASVAEQYEKHGISLSPANTNRVSGAAELLRRLGDVERGIAPTLVISERCARLIECLPALEHDPARPEDVLKWDTDEDGQGGDDPYDAARYGIMAVAGSSGWGQNPFAGYRGQ